MLLFLWPWALVAWAAGRHADALLDALPDHLRAAYGLDGIEDVIA